MTHPKRPFSNISGGDGGSNPLSSPTGSSSMKKAKAQQASVEREKNGLNSHHFDVPAAGGSEDEDSMLVDQAGASSIATTGVASNLSRKKATPPQPTVKKALKIKLNKGFGGQYFNLLIDGVLQPGKKAIEDCSRSRNSLYIPDILKTLCL